ncbi:MAG: hypothetical protein HKN94_09420 [Acidimicrobiales bacterium]|nr:hypothetical protein [Acidimicrobiales bacterium]RZV48352.1 MAG: hypothetical protein EX269_02075 [Acidimicrobiales bacterium]
MRKWWLALMIVALVASACGGSDAEVVSDVLDEGTSSSDDGSDAGDDSGSDDGGSDDADEPADVPADDPDPEDEEPDPDFSGSGSGDFCDTAREFEENDPLEDLDFFDADFFDAATELWNGILPSVPDELRPDVEVIIANFDDMRAIAEKYDYNFMSEGALAEFEAMDTTEMDAAGARFDAYLEDVCGIDTFDSDGTETLDDMDIDLDELGIDLDDIDFDELSEAELTSAAAFVAQIFGVDVETAECLVGEFGALSDPSAVDLSRMDEPVCGTTLNEVFAGLGG